jgi:putative SOS response-associated peptidase YedK
MADGFYEWRKSDKRPHFISLKSGEQMAFAGLWETWKSPEGPVDSCTIYTTDAHDMMGQLHDRMPVVVSHATIDHWLDPRVNEADELKPMLAQFPGDEMQAWPVGKAVGDVRNRGPSLMEPVGVQPAQTKCVNDEMPFAADDLTNCKRAP